jgi:hypothetical protein
LPPAACVLGCDEADISRTGSRQSDGCVTVCPVEGGTGEPENCTLTVVPAHAIVPDGWFMDGAGVTVNIEIQGGACTAIFGSGDGQVAGYGIRSPRWQR